MKKHTSEEAFHERIRNLAGVKQNSVNESNTRTLGTLIDFERAADGVAYGIVKEQHKYYIKKGGLNENLTVADFAYIGGMQNITDYQYSKLGEAEKQRNFLLKTVNEGITTKVSPNGSKKKVLTEDKASQEIDMAASKVDDLEAATDAAGIPAPEPAMPDDGAAEMDAGLEAMDGGGEEMPADDIGADEIPADDMGGEVAPEGGDEMPADDMGDEVAPEGGDEEITGDEEEVAVEDPKSEATREIEKSLGKLTNTLRKTELTEPQVKSYVNSFLSAFKDDFPEIDIEDRKAMAEKITKVVPPEDIEDLGQSVEDAEGIEPEELDIAAEGQCAECGGFAQYAESRGYTAESIQECGEEEMTNLVSGYANGHAEGQNDGDFKAIALFITPEIIEKLKGDYGHDEFADQVEPFSQEMNETTEEDKIAQINELFGNIGSMIKGGAGKIGGDIAGGIKKAGQAVGQKVQQAGQAVGDYATGIKQAAHSAVVPAEVKKLEAEAGKLGQQIAALNSRLTKAGKEEVDIKSIMKAISQQLGAAKGKGIAGLGLAEEGIPVDHTEVQPMMEEDAIEEDVNITVSEKAGKKLSADNVPQVEMKEGEEPEGDVIDDIEVDAEKEGEEDVLDLTKHEEPEMPMISGVDAMGGGVVKPEGAEVTTVEVTKDSVKVEMNESEAKLRKYIRNRLEEQAGLKKPSLNESKKSEKLQKLDRIIDKQFNLFEAEAKKKVDENINEIFGMGIKEKFAKLDPNDDEGVKTLFNSAFKDILINLRMRAIGDAARRLPTPQKYELLRQYVDGNGGTLRLSNGNVVYQPQSVKNAATPGGLGSASTLKRR